MITCDIDNQVSAQNIITATSILANTIKHHKSLQIKVKEPNLFDSTNLWKLINFISQCQLTFYASLDVYQDDDQKVSFAMIYLHRAALDIFELYLIDPTDTSD